MLIKKQSEPSPTWHVSLAEQGESAVAPVTSEVSGAEVFRRAGSKTSYTRRRPVKIVFVAANTRDGERLQLDEEYRTIEQAIRGARYRDVFQLIPKLAVRRSDVQDALLEHSPDVVHFACYGSTRAELLLLDDGPGAAPISAEALAGLFRVPQDKFALVVFNAWFANGQAEAIRQYADSRSGCARRSRTERRSRSPRGCTGRWRTADRARDSTWAWRRWPRWIPGKRICHSCSWAKMIRDVACQGGSWRQSVASALLCIDRRKVVT